MKTKTISLVAVSFALLMITGCQTAPMTAKTTLDPMKGVGQVQSVRRTTEVTPTGTNIVMIELNESPEAAQKELRMKELEARTQVGVAKAKAKSSGGGGSLNMNLKRLSFGGGKK